MQRRRNWSNKLSLSVNKQPNYGQNSTPLKIPSKRCDGASSCVRNCAPVSPRAQHFRKENKSPSRALARPWRTAQSWVHFYYTCALSLQRRSKLDCGGRYSRYWGRYCELWRVESPPCDSLRVKAENECELLRTIRERIAHVGDARWFDTHFANYHNPKDLYS